MGRAQLTSTPLAERSVCGLSANDGPLSEWTQASVIRPLACAAVRRALAVQRDSADTPEPRDRNAWQSRCAGAVGSPRFLLGDSNSPSGGPRRSRAADGVVGLLAEHSGSELTD